MQRNTTHRSMPTRSAIALLTGFCLLASGVIALAGHEHASETLRAAGVCFVDHGSDRHVEVDQSSDRSGARYERRAQSHEHHCVACHAGSKRGLATPAVVESEAPDQRALIGPPAAFELASIGSTPHDPRGPPAPESC